MKINSLIFHGSRLIKTAIRSSIETGSPQEFEKIRDDNLPTACLVVKENLPKLCEFKDLIVNRGIKNKHKGLAGYLLERDSKSSGNKIQIIDGNYNDAGQLKRGINTLLSRAIAIKYLGFFIIGVEETVFKAVWEAATDDKREKLAVKLPVRLDKRFPEMNGADETACELLNDLVERCKVPQELEDAFIGISWKVDLVRKFIVLAAQRSAPVLILGDTGTGKEIVARKIHDSGGKDRPYKSINCGGIPTELFESELFGHEPNCFTGAGPKVKKGLWELADKGTLFLDEIGDLPMKQQVKILRALGEGTIRRLCGTEDIKVNARVIAATNRDLSSMVQNGQFREDLYYRLRGFLIHTPALKDHPEDIPLLARHFWRKITDGTKMLDSDRLSTAARLPQSVLEELELYRWPGNARELKMVLNNLYALTGNGEVRVKDLKYVFYLQGQNWSTQNGPMTERGADLIRGDCWRHLKRADEVVRAAKFALQPVIGPKKANSRTIDSVCTYLEYHLGELTILCREHMLFHSQKTFSSVLKFKENLNFFHDLLHKDIAKARVYWKEALAEEFDSVLSVIFREGERVLGKG